MGGPSLGWYSRWYNGGFRGGYDPSAPPRFGYGARATRIERRVLDRELVEVETAYGKVRVKIGRLSGKVLSAAPEFEDCRQAAERQGVAVKEVMAAALSAFRGTS